MRWILPWSMILSACTFEPPQFVPLPLPTPSTTPLATIVDSGEVTVLEEPGEMLVRHGFTCAESDSSDRQDILRVREQRTIPQQLDRATVILSGWQFRYTRGDHEMLALGTGIFNIGRDKDVLSWEAWGAITDENFDDPYRWCYRFTLLAWQRAVYTADPDHRDAHTFQGNDRAGWETALSFHPNYTTTGYLFTPNSAILPRGFGFAWEDGDDRNLLQLAYNLDYSEGYIADGKDYVQPSPNLGGADRTEPSFRSWETKTILKDNATRRDYITGELISVMSSLRGGLVQPPFTIVPVEDKSNCVASSDPPTETRTIQGVPFDVAIPILTGWDLSYVCDDQHVEEIGIWIDDFDYTPSGQRGTIDYTVRAVLHDDDDRDAVRFRHRVGILGFDRAP